MEDFLQGTPNWKKLGSKAFRKFNRELLKSTCQVIGCKPLLANQIAEGVFDEMNSILNNFVGYPDFDHYFI